jgi:hypothetical protein
VQLPASARAEATLKLYDMRAMRARRFVVRIALTSPAALELGLDCSGSSSPSAPRCCTRAASDISTQVASFVLPAGFSLRGAW